MTLLALDISSTWIGWVVRRDGALVAYGTSPIGSGDATIGQRIGRAFPLFMSLVATYQPRVLAFEGPAHKTYPLAMIAQQRIAGVALLVAAQQHVPTIEISPSAAKKVLTGYGRSDKQQMIAAAFERCGERLGEHEADALAVALAAEQQTEHVG